METIGKKENQLSKKHFDTAVGIKSMVNNLQDLQDRGKTKKVHAKSIF